eukprot:UC1_evm2s1726
MDEERKQAAKRCYQLWRVWCTLKHMVKDRGYRVTQEQLNMTLDQWMQTHCGSTDPTESPSKETLSFAAELEADSGDKILAVFQRDDEEQVSSDTIKRLFLRMRDHGFRKAILVVEN